MKIKIEIETTKKETTEKEIYFPYYSTDGNYHYCINSEKDTIRLSVSSDNTSAWMCRVDGNSLMQEAAKCEATSEDIFQENYYKALKIITGVDIREVLLEAAGELSESIRHHASQDGITATNDTQQEYKS